MHTHTLEPLDTSTSATQTSVPVWERGRRPTGQQLGSTCSGQPAGTETRCQVLEENNQHGRSWEVPALDRQQVL